jgi:hypothetical protein
MKSTISASFAAQDRSSGLAALDVDQVVAVPQSLREIKSARRESR